MRIRVRIRARVRVGVRIRVRVKLQVSTMTITITLTVNITITGQLGDGTDDDSRKFVKVIANVASNSGKRAMVIRVFLR